MANNVEVTAGTGTSVATDDVSGVHYQVVKVAVGTEDSAVRIGQLEDAAHSSGDGGIMALAVRQSTATDLSAGGTNGDYEPLQVDANGRLWVNSVVASPGATDLTKLEDAVHASGDAGVMALAVRKDTATAVAADGDYVPLIVDASGRLHVSVGAIAAGETHLGEVGGKTAVIKPTIAVDTSIYAALDVLGAAAASGVVTITGAARVSGGSGVIDTIALFDDDNEKNPITLLFFDAAPASGTYTGNGALALSTGDKAKYVGKVNIFASDYETLGGDAFVCLRGVGLAFKCSGSADLFMIPLVSSGTPTYTASTDIQMVVSVLQD